MSIKNRCLVCLSLTKRWTVVVVQMRVAVDVGGAIFLAACRCRVDYNSVPALLSGGSTNSVRLQCYLGISCSDSGSWSAYDGP
jgi:hypothetical protein